MPFKVPVCGVIIENYKNIVITLNEFVCQSIEFLPWEFGILCEEDMTWWYIESLILQWNSIYNVAYLPMH